MARFTETLGRHLEVAARVRETAVALGEFAAGDEDLLERLQAEFMRVSNDRAMAVSILEARA